MWSTAQTSSRSTAGSERPGTPLGRAGLSVVRGSRCANSFKHQHHRHPHGRTGSPEAAALRRTAQDRPAKVGHDLLAASCTDHGNVGAGLTTPVAASRGTPRTQVTASSCAADAKPTENAACDRRSRVCWLPARRSTVGARPTTRLSRGIAGPSARPTRKRPATRTAMPSAAVCGQPRGRPRS